MNEKKHKKKNEEVSMADCTVHNNCNLNVDLWDGENILSRSTVHRICTICGSWNRNHYFHIGNFRIYHWCYF